MSINLRALKKKKWQTNEWQEKKWSKTEPDNLTCSSKNHA